MRSLSTLAFLLLAVPTFAAEPKVQKDIPYVDNGHERQKLDVYAPAEGKNLPIMFWIHGGGWQGGDKKEADKKPQAFVDKGFVFVSVNYRMLGDKVTIKQMAQDITKGLRWVLDHAKDYNADASTLFISGHSAGAQLAALICTDERYFKAEKISFAIVKGCIPVDGDTYDVPLQIATVEERRSTIYKQKFGDEASQKDLSPVTHATKDKGIPPFLILHVADHKEVKMQSEKLAKLLSEASVPAKAYPAENKTHTTINSELGVPEDKPTKAMWEFIESKLKK